MDERMADSGGAEGLVAYADHEKTALGVYAGLIVKRDRLLHDLAMHGKDMGISVVCAPRGFGVSALLRQYVSVVQSDPARGAATYLDVARLDCAGVIEAVEAACKAMPAGSHPLLALDHLPRFDRDASERIASTLRALREHDVEAVVGCVPIARPFMQAMGDAHKVSAQHLLVRPDEYRAWARAFALSPALDVYELTRGVPALVALLERCVGREPGYEALDAGTAEILSDALVQMRSARDPLYRIASLMVLTGSGALHTFAAVGLRLRSGLMERLAHDWPLFGVDLTEQTYRCLGSGAAIRPLREELARRRPAFAEAAARMLMLSGRVDESVAFAEAYLDERARLDLVAEFPADLALAGHARFIGDSIAEAGRVPRPHAHPGALTATYMVSLLTGEYRMARKMAAELGRRADEIRSAVSPRQWAAAVALARGWRTCSGIELPYLPAEHAVSASGEDAYLLDEHARIYAEIMGGTGPIEWHDVVDRLSSRPTSNAVDVPRLLLMADGCLDRAIHEGGGVAAGISRMEGLLKPVVERGLFALAVRIRMTVNVCRLVEGEPMEDERGFMDAGAAAVRESDQLTQLFCMVAEGWQDLIAGQAVNAQFRGQQVMRLAGSARTMLYGWGRLLDRVAHLRNTSPLGIADEAEMLDLSEECADPAEAWTIALHLSAARLDSELAAWFSLHKHVLLVDSIRPIARVAISVLGERAASLCRILPDRVRDAYRMDASGSGPDETLYDVVVSRERDIEMGQLVFSLFGGFQVSKNGHALTDSMWKRRKACVVAERLALDIGVFVTRRELIDMLWPTKEYGRARSCLYVTLSALRAAMGQHETGPQYLLTQGEGLALNREFATSDTNLFDTLAREILTHGDRLDAKQTVEACLKLEGIYKGPLQVPDAGDTSLFARMRDMYASKYVDCMVRGIDEALDVENLSAAGWLAEAALRQEPNREDLIRRAMKVYGLMGRRREAARVYQAHLGYLQRELHDAPEIETREMYERVVGPGKGELLI